MVRREGFDTFITKDPMDYPSIPILYHLRIKLVCGEGLKPSFAGGLSRCPQLDDPHITGAQGRI